MKNKRVWSELILIKNEFVAGESKKLVTHLSDNEFLIDIDGLNASLAPVTFLYEILSPLGFTSKMIYEIVEMKEKSVSIGLATAYSMPVTTVLIVMSLQAKATKLLFILKVSQVIPAQSRTHKCLTKYRSLQTFSRVSV